MWVGVREGGGEAESKPPNVFERCKAGAEAHVSFHHFPIWMPDLHVIGHGFCLCFAISVWHADNVAQA